MSEKQLGREIKRLEKQMLTHARNLEFEEAAQARDRLAELRRRAFGVDGERDEAARLRAAG
jgi:excinuclease ABC subunit B